MSCSKLWGALRVEGKAEEGKQHEACDPVNCGARNNFKY